MQIKLLVATLLRGNAYQFFPEFVFCFVTPITKQKNKDKTQGIP